MRRSPRRGLFWQVYPTLLASLVAVAVLGAIVGRLLGVAPLGGHLGPGAQVARALRLHNLAMLLVVAAVVGIAAYPVMSRITRRLEALRRSVEAWGGGDASRRAAVDGTDEIAAVAASFNAAADRAEALLTAHKALLAHASHELRSPLTRLAVAVELMAEGGDAIPPAAVRREIAELDRLVEEILLASRLDHGADIGEPERVDCLALAAEEAARASIPLGSVVPGAPGFTVIGSSRLLRRMIRNLIDNALKHGGPPVDIDLAHGALHNAPAVIVVVRDHGPGIPAALRDRVFEPFYRPDGRSEVAGGSGLGLALVRQIAERHGGRASCAAADDATTFTVILPAAPAERAAESAAQPPSAMRSR